MKMKKPDFFIVGAPRCGTTAMYYYLKQHTDIFMPKVKEPKFFGSDLTLDPNRRTLDWYLSLFVDAKDEKRIGEASTTYLYSKRAASELREFNDQSRIIIMIRNPIDMLYSVYYYRLSHDGLENIKNFEDAIYANSEKAMMFRSEMEKKIGRTLPNYLDYPRFYDQIRRYFEVFDKDKIHIIVYDDFKEATKNIYQKVLDFLDVDNSLLPNFEVINANKKVRSRIIQTVGRRIGRFPYKETLLKYPFIVRFKNTINQYNIISYQRPEMDPNLKKRLQTEYFDDVHKLSEILGRDLTHWVRS